MKKHLLLLVAAFGLLLTTSTAQVVLEDFEGGTADLTWEDLDGTYNGVVMNPDSNRVNMSGFAGSYTKDTMAGFSLFLARLATPLDLSTNNQVSIDILASEATRFILKLEGPGGQAIEGNSNIPINGQWRRYTFDFSTASGLDSLNTILLFFDYGNDTGGGTYLFDNITLGTSPCSGTARDTRIVDDFECQRTTIGAGFDSLFVVPNPAPDAVNGAGPVGEYRDPQGAFSALVYNSFDDIDLEDNPVVKLKYWAPRTNRLLVKLEGGSSPAREIFIDVTEINSWQEYEADFSQWANNSFKSLAIFANAGEEAEGVAYYFDDIRFEEKTETIIEDFEGASTTLFWQPANNNSAVNGTFNVSANPDVQAPNETAQIGEHVKGSAMLSTLVGLSATPIDLSSESQLNMYVWAPAGSQEVRLSAISASQGRLDMTRTIDATERWIEVGFNLEAFAAATDVNTLELVFDPMLGGARTYYFDQLRLGAGTIDPCEGTIPEPRTVDDFECQRNAEIVAGGNELNVIDNPDFTNNPSDKVGEYTDPDDLFSALVYEFDTPLDLAVFNNVSVDIWSAKLVPLGFKLEASLNGAPNIEKVVDVTEVDSWQNYRVDFAEAAGGQYTKLVIFFNFAQQPGSNTDIYYVDNVELRRGPVTACVTDFETPNTTIDEWTGFAGGSTNDDAFSVVTNPDQSGANMSATVGQFLESADGESFAGIFTNFGAPVLFPDPANKTISALVWSPDVIDFVMKLENSAAGAPQTGDVFPVDQYSTPGAWQMLTWDFSNFDTDAAQFQNITLIPGIGEVPTELRVTYFDEIRIGSAMCGVSSTRTPREDIGNLQAWPNPAQDMVQLSLPAGTSSVLMIDALGRTVAHEPMVADQDGTVRQLSVANLQTGFYTAVALGNRGQVIARVRLAVSH